MGPHGFPHGGNPEIRLKAPDFPDFFTQGFPHEESGRLGVFLMRNHYDSS